MNNFARNFFNPSPNRQFLKLYETLVVASLSISNPSRHCFLLICTTFASLQIWPFELCCASRIIWRALFYPIMFSILPFYFILSTQKWVYYCCCGLLHLILLLLRQSRCSLLSSTAGIYYYWNWVWESIKTFYFTEFKNLSKPSLLLTLRIPKTSTFTEFEKL